MAKLEVIQEGEYVSAAGADDPDLNQAFWDFREAIEREANAGGTIAVYECPVDHMGNIRPATYQRAKLFSCPVGQVTVDDICDRVLRDFVEPGGKIVIQLLARKDGEKGIKMNKYISLRKGKAGSEGGVPSELAQILRVMSEQNSRTLAAIQSMAENRGNVQPAGDPMEKALAIADRIASLTNKVQGSSGGMMGGDANNPMNQFFTMMLTRMMKDFFDKRDAPPPDTGASTILENIRALAAPLLTAKATQEERALVAEKRMLIHERANAPSSAAAQAPEAQKTEPQSAPAASSAATDEAKMKLLAVLKEGLPMIVSLAKGPKPADPAETAKLVLKNLPEDEQALNDAFYALVQDPPAEFLGQLAVVCPEVREHAEWFEKFRQALLIEFDPDKLTPA